MSRGRFDRLGASSTLCHAHHSCVHIVTDTPPPVTGTCHTALVLCVCLGVHRLAVWLFECQIWFIVLPPPPSMCSSCFIVHVWWNAQHSRSDQMPNPSQCIVLRGVHGICSRSWPGLDF